MPERITIEVAYAEPSRQFLRRLELEAGATIADAIEASGVGAACAIDPAALASGIWSKPAPRAAVLADGDRVELYRPLKADPKEARRRRAESARVTRR
ncbi:RnfH family protein [Dokdonella sp.]|uniref:RnfH family protein n=1 Tax=Dokdonella sp. TaxID=2291710 RepID=UPI002F41F84E